MKRIGVLLGIILLLLSGCSTQKKKLNVSEWMFSEHLNIATVKAVLGAPYDTEEKYTPDIRGLFHTKITPKRMKVNT